jgi:NAD(P)-dependent dehydrogenase (short-subunit alcohol dehydrogenase family)
MVPFRRGSIAIIASSAGLFAPVTFAAYAASKAYVYHLGQHLRIVRPLTRSSLTHTRTPASVVVTLVHAQGRLTVPSARRPPPFAPNPALRAP